jgi:hypothetical protein
VAKALAAFTHDVSNHSIKGSDGVVRLPAVTSLEYIGIVMIGTGPRFYKININRDLVDAVRDGLFPAEETVIQRFVPPVPNGLSFLRGGMQPLDNRHVCFQCFEALKALL